MPHANGRGRSASSHAPQGYLVDIFRGFLSDSANLLHQPWASDRCRSAACTHADAISLRPDGLSPHPVWLGGLSPHLAWPGGLSPHPARHRIPATLHLCPSVAGFERRLPVVRSLWPMAHKCWNSRVLAQDQRMSRGRFSHRGSRHAPLLGFPPSRD